MLRITPFFAVSWVPEGYGHIAGLAYCELRILHRQRNISVTIFCLGNDAIELQAVRKINEGYQICHSTGLQ